LTNGIFASNLFAVTSGQRMQQAKKKMNCEINERDAVFKVYIYCVFVNKRDVSPVLEASKKGHKLFCPN
jgi:hypothetical protein